MEVEVDSQDRVEHAVSSDERSWSAWLQRRLMRLLLQHDQRLFRHQFRTFFVESSLPQIPLLQQYDNYIKLMLLSSELLDDLLPRVRRQLSLQTDHARLLEEAPTRGDVDWQRTIGRTLRESPGLPPTRFDTRLRQRSTTTPENLFTVAVLLAYCNALQQIQCEGLGDEALSQEERQVFIGDDERAERELAAPYARDLIQEAQGSDIALLAERVLARLRPGPNPYRDLVDWWQRFQQLAVGRGSGDLRLSLASLHEDEKVEARLYELWIVLELAHFLHERQAIQPADTSIEQDRLSFLFTWQGRRFRFRYNRQREESAGDEATWEHGPASRPDYTIERDPYLQVLHEHTLIWREPPFVMDAKYYLAGNDPARTHGPIKKLLGDMSLLDAEQGVLFFPLLPEPLDEQHITRTIQRKAHRHPAGRQLQAQIHLYRLSPDLPLESLQARLAALLDHASRCLPERSEPVCEGVWLDPDSLNASESAAPSNTILCRKRHIGEGVFDLVDAELHCLKDPTMCHVIGKGIVRPEVVRVTTREGLQKKSSNVRSRNDEQLHHAEAAADEEKAEALRKQIFENVGGAVEHYVQSHGDTRPIEDNFKRWVFRGYWDGGTRSLALETRNMLLSGEYVWYEYSKTTLNDWAAPAIQYCRALEFEVRRRIYKHHPASPKGAPPDPTAFKVGGAGWTLGSLEALYYSRNSPKGDLAHNWRLVRGVLNNAGCTDSEFMQLLKRFVDSEVKTHRNHLAHGDPIAQSVADALRETIIGAGGKPGILCWLVEHLEPVD